jgi:hypothetical protein
MKQSDVNLGIAFAERNKTAQMLGDTMSSIARAYRHLRRGEWKKTCDELGIGRQKPRGNNVPKQWLGYQYGWKPLLSDVYGSVEALAKRNNRDWRVTGKGNANSTEQVGDEFFGSAGGYRVAAKGERGVFVRIDAIPENDLMRSFSQLGITNPLLIAWELVPFSFVIDWALPIGQFLDSLDAMLGYGPTWCSITEFSDWRFRMDSVGGDYVGTDGYINQYKYSTAPGTRRRLAVKRTVLRSVPLPSLPRLKDPRSLGHMANGLALAASILGGRR